MISGGCVASVFLFTAYRRAHCHCPCNTHHTEYDALSQIRLCTRLQSASPHTSLIRRAIHRRNTRYTKTLTRSERNPMKDSKRNLRMMCEAAVIAALYAAITYAAAPLASGVIQVRISEALCALPIFTPSAIPGVTLGCLLANLLTGSPLPDVIFGTLATPHRCDIHRAASPSSDTRTAPADNLKRHNRAACAQICV